MSLKTKSLLKDFCKYVYYAGAGNCWDEDIYKETIMYKMYSTISFSVYTTMIFLENLAALFGNFPEVEKNSAVMFSAIHNIVLAKMFLLLYHKKSIRKLNYEMATVGENFEEEYIMRRQQRKVKLGITSYIISVYLSLTAYGVESARRSIIEGAPFYTVVTYLPFYESTSIFASFFRIFFYITWLYMMLPMMSADCMPITHLIAMTYKFITLCRHYEKIRLEFDKNILKMSNKSATEKLKAGCLEGIKMHQKLLRVYVIVGRTIVCITQSYNDSYLHLNEEPKMFANSFQLSPHLDLTNAFMTYTFVGSLFLLLALNLWNAGEITYQASLLSNAMFDCGWHLCVMEKESHRDIRRLVLIGCAQAQKPLILKAFGIQDLSYETFVSVARMTYSVFAVFYQRGE